MCYSMPLGSPLLCVSSNDLTQSTFATPSFIVCTSGVLHHLGIRLFAAFNKYGTRVGIPVLSHRFFRVIEQAFPGIHRNVFSCYLVYHPNDSLPIRLDFYTFPPQVLEGPRRITSPPACWGDIRSKPPRPLWRHIPSCQ